MCNKCYLCVHHPKLGACLNQMKIRVSEIHRKGSKWIRRI